MDDMDAWIGLRSIGKAEINLAYLSAFRNFACMSRILAIDYGKKRCGVAATDPLQIIANGLCTVATGELLSFLVDYAAKEPVEQFVIGLPVQTNGEASENQARVREFAKRLQKQFPAIPITFYDERFTSKIAHQAMIDGGLHRKQRQNKALVDEISATIILQSFMESKRNAFPI